MMFLLVFYGKGSDFRAKIMCEKITSPFLKRGLALCEGSAVILYALSLLFPSSSLSVCLFTHILTFKICYLPYLRLYDWNDVSSNYQTHISSTSLMV